MTPPIWRRGYLVPWWGGAVTWAIGAADMVLLVVVFRDSIWAAFALALVGAVGMATFCALTSKIVPPEVFDRMGVRQ